MYSCIKKIGLFATAVALFMGSVTPHANNNFNENDSGFHHISNILSSDWSWGFNKASATTEDECYDIWLDNQWAKCWITEDTTEGTFTTYHSGYYINNDHLDPDYNSSDYNDTYNDYDYDYDYGYGYGGSDSNNSSSAEVCAEIKSTRPAHCEAMVGSDMFWPYTQDPSIFWNIPAAKNGCGSGSTIELAIANLGEIQGFNGFTGNINRPLAGYRFRRACNTHDLCYNASSSRSGCDANFRKTLGRICDSNEDCQGFADLYSGAVRTFGKEPYIEAGLIQQCRDFKDDMEKNKCD